MSALLLHVTGLLCGTLMAYTSAELPRGTQIHTLKGNSMGRPCVFPFQYKNTWHFECTREGRNDGMSWCATTKNYDVDDEWGFCPLSGDGCDLLWEVNSATRICYQFNLQSALSWKSAYESCRAQGGDLLSIRNLTEQNYISEKLKNADTMLWIGLHQLDGLFGWQWSDGAALAFVNWKRNSTPWYHERRHCGTYYAREEYKWHTSECESKLPYVCKKYLTPRHHDLYKNWKYRQTQSSGKLQKEEFSWSEASAACHSDGGELMSVNSLADVEFLVHLLDHENVSEAWIGMSSKVSTSAEFQWSDGSAVTLTSWQRHEPNINLEGSDLCVATQRTDGNWKVKSCSRKLFSVCEPPSMPQTIDDSGVTNEPCAENWVRHGNYCYGTDLRDQTFIQVASDSSCPPATITNRFEQAFINSLISSKIIPGDVYFWIALQDINKTGQYMWLVDGKEQQVVSFTNWDTQEPGYNGGCVVLSSGINIGRWKVRNCKGAFAKSLCKKPLRFDGERKSNSQEGNMEQACVPSWDTEPLLHHCYRVFHHEKLMRKRTWQEAEDLCQDFGAHLVSLSNLEEKRFVEELLATMFKGDRKRQFWIGFNKRNPSSGDSWEWSDGSPVVSSFWLDMHSTDDSNNCGMYRAHRANRRLAALNCDAHLEWICKIPKGVIPKNPDWHIRDIPWVFYQGNDYYFYDLNADFASAEFACGWMRSKVTSILNRAEQAVIHKRIKQMSKGKQKWWIGLVNEYEGFKRWQDGQSLIFTNWEKDPPSNINGSITAGEKQCAYIESDTGLWGYSDCLSENPVICKTNIMFKIEKPYAPVDMDHDQEYGICPEGWLYYANKCFLVHKYENMMDWSAASYFCREHSGRLATITNEIEQAFIVMQLYGEKKGFWIGLTKKDYDLWENGTVETYNNWVPTRYTNNGVNPYEQEQLCALISANQSVHPTGKWYLEKCNSKIDGIICEKEQGISNPATNGSDMFPISETMEYGDKQYRIISGNMSWYNASIVCQKLKSKLVSITDPYHQAFVTILAHHLGYPLWIGYYSTENRGDFKWTDGSMSLFTSWADEESPSDGNCTYVDTSGHWRAEDCNIELQGALCLPSRDSGYDYYVGRCPEDWIRFKHFCYSIHTVLTNKQFHEAEELCKEHDGEILTISGDEEAAFIRYEMKTLTSVQSIWLGRITPGDSIRYAKWNEETMNADTLIGDYCVSMWIDGTWRIAQCYDRRGFVCKKMQDNTEVCGPQYWKVKRHHFIISIAVVSTVVLAIFTWYLLKRNICFSSPNIQRLQCTQYSPETDEADLWIPTGEET